VIERQRDIPPRSQCLRLAWKVVDRPTYLLDRVAPAADGPCLLAGVLASVHIAERGSAGTRCVSDGLVLPVVIQRKSEARMKGEVEGWVNRRRKERRGGRIAPLGQ
jgi:hypothetical protein